MPSRRRAAEGAAEGHYYRTVPDPLDIGGKAYVQGISTRSVDDLVKPLQGLLALSSSEIG